MNDISELIITLTFAIVLIFINGYIRCKYWSGADILMTKLGVYDLDGWSMTHLALFTYIGYRFPSHFVEAMSMGILWELWEYWCGEYRPSWMGGFGDCDLTTHQIDSTHKNWWFGRYSDIIMNLSGFILGYSIRNKYYNNIYL